VMGGDFNADTQQTVTQYLYSVPAADLDIALHIEAIRMRGLTVSKRDWDQERGAITQEVAQDLSSPLYRLSTKLREALFAGTSYAHDALGTKESFEKTTAGRLQRFHKRWYAPNNATLIVVGDVDPAAALARIRQLFERIPARKLPPRSQLALRPVVPQSLTLDSDLPYGLQVIALRMPGFDSPDYPAAEVLTDILKSRRGKLYALVPEGKALGTDFTFDGLPKAGLAYAVGAFPVGSDPKALESEMRSILADIAKNGVPADLVAAAKLQERRGAEVQKNSINGLAMVWSEAVAVEGLRSPDEDLERIEKVQVEDVNRVARRYLDLDQAVSAVLIPRDSGKPVLSRGFGGGEHITLGEVKPTALPSWARAVVERLTVPDSKVHPVVSQLPNGITLIVQPEAVSDIITVYGHIKNRPELQVPKGKDGLSDVVEDLFPYGTQQLDRIALQSAYDAIGAEGQAGREFRVQALSEHFEQAVELLAQNQLHPAFPEEAFKVVKKQVGQTVASRLNSPSYLSGRALLAAVYPKDDPSQREALPATVESITLQDVRDYYQAAFRPDLATIVVIGKVTPERARAVIEKNFAAWTATGPKPETDLPPVPPNAPTVTAVPDASRVQDRVTLAEALNLTRSNPDYYALELGNNVLGGSFYSTRLTRDIRMAAGLVYSIDSALQIGKTRGIYFVQYACDPQNVSKVHSMVLRELRQMQSTPASEGELQRAKALLLHRIPLQEASVSHIAQAMIQRTVLGLPLDESTIAARRYLALDAPAVQAAFAKWIRPDDLARVTQGPTPK
jgi:zinc protease